MTPRFEGPGWQDVGGEPEDDEGPPPPSPPEWSPGLVRPLGTRAALARAGLALATLATLVAVVFDVDQYRLLSRVGTGEPVAPSDLFASDDRLAVIAVVGGLLFVLAAMLFIAWLHHAYKNLEPLGARAPRYSPGWAIGAWFVPILNLFRPKQIANDVWRASDPALPAPSHGWRDGPVHPVLTAWWAAWLLAATLSTVSQRLAYDATDVDSLEPYAGFLIAADAVAALAGVLAFVVVDLTTARQAARVAALSGQEARPAPWLRSPRSLVAAAALCALAVGIGLLTIEVQPSSPVSAEDTADRAVTPGLVAPADYSVRDDFSDPATGWIEDDHDEAAFAYEQGRYRILVKRPGGLWFSLSALGVSLEEIAVEADATIRTTSDGDGFGLGCYSSQAAGYVFTVWRDGYYAIELDPRDTEELSVLADGSGAPVSPRGANRMRIECTSGPPTTLRLHLNGREVAETTHDGELGLYRIVTLSVSSVDGGGTADFDDVLVERPE